MDRLEYWNDLEGDVDAGTDDWMSWSCDEAVLTLSCFRLSVADKEK